MHTVLVVEDQVNIRKFVSVNLTVRGFHVTEAANGVEGLRRLQEGQPDVVLLDMKMPELSGEDVLEFMQEDPQLAQVPVIVMTASTSASAVDRQRYRNVLKVIVKPVTAAELLVSITEIVTRQEGR